jgi:predicted ribosome quality control (RQC) complex YloA/Tae2 family protein
MKEAICAEIEKAVEEKNGTIELLNELSHRFNEIGFVPKKSISTSKTRFQTAVDKYIATLQGVSEDEKERTSLEIQLGSLKDDPNADRKIFHKEQAVRKRMQKVENDIALWKNNIEFFGRSKNAEKVKEEFNEKIKEATEQLKQLKSQLKMLKTVS